MISGQYSGMPVEVSSSNDAAQSSQANQTSQSEQSSENSRQNSNVNGVGKRFLDVLNSILGRNKKPVAYVRRGKEVSFESIPFYDTSGSRLSFEKAESGKLVIKRKGRPGTRAQREVDTSLKRELALSGNHGVARSIPEFRNRAHQHLRKTEEVRRKILSGEIETPGNKDGLLRKQLKEQAKADGEVLDAAWLEEVRAHLNRNKGGDLRKLKAQIAAMANKKGEEAKSEIELEDPRAPRVKQFAPKVVSGDSADHVVKTKAVEGDEAVDAIKKAIARGKKKEKAEVEQRNVVQRIEIKKADLPKPGEAESRSLEIIRQLKGKKGAEAEAVEQKSSKKDPVREMREKGWRTHAPKGERAEPEVDALRGERARQPVAEVRERAKEGKANAEGGSFRGALEQSEAAKTSDLARAQSTQPIHSSSSNSTNGQQNANAGSGSSTQQATANDAQTQSRGIENLQQLLTRMETSARVLTSRGSTTLRVTLRPPELGAVSVQIREDGGKYSVQMKVDNEEAARVVEKHAPLIRDAMADRGIQVDNIEVKSGQQQQADAFDQHFDGREGSQKTRSGRPQGRGQMSDHGDTANSEGDNPVLRSLKLGTNTMETVG